MKLEQQVVSLELAKKMKELGFKQESLFYWKESKTTEIHYNHFLGIPSFMSVEEVANHPIYSAYTVAELGEMLPVRTHTGKRKRPQYTYYSNYDYGNKIHYQSNASTEADARGNLLILLKENKLI